VWCIASACFAKPDRRSRLESAKSAPAWATVIQLIDAMDVSLPELAQTVEKARRLL